MDCICNLRDSSSKILSCGVLDQIGRLLMAEDLPRFCEHCPVRPHSIRFLYMPPGVSSWSWRATVELDVFSSRYSYKIILKV